MVLAFLRSTISYSVSSPRNITHSANSTSIPTRKLNVSQNQPYLDNPTLGLIEKILDCNIFENTQIFLHPRYLPHNDALRGKYHNWYLLIYALLIHTAYHPVVAAPARRESHSPPQLLLIDLYYLLYPIHSGVVTPAEPKRDRTGFASETTRSRNE